MRRRESSLEARLNVGVSPKVARTARRRRRILLGMIGLEDQQRLLALARNALEARVRRLHAPPIAGCGALDDWLGAFVTLHLGGELRGCIGRIEPEAPLAGTVAHLAAIVADSDPRFEPVTPAELVRIDVEISVLSDAREVAGMEEIEVGRHGVIIEQGRRRGLLLPQVSVEHGWDRATFLDHACLKAGLPAGAWRDGARMLVFEAQVFGEREMAAAPGT